MNVLKKSKEELESLLNANPRWNALEALEGLSGLPATERQRDQADPQMSYSGLNDPDTIQSIPHQVHSRRKALFEYVPWVFSEEVLWSLVSLTRFSQIDMTPDPNRMAMRVFPSSMRSFMRKRGKTFFMPPLNPVTPTFHKAIGRDPGMEAIDWYTDDWDAKDYRQSELDRAIRSGRKA